MILDQHVSWLAFTCFSCVVACLCMTILHLLKCQNDTYQRGDVYYGKTNDK